MKDVLSNQERELLQTLQAQGYDTILQDMSRWDWKMYPAGISVAVHSSGKFKATRFEFLCSGDSWVTIEPINGGPPRLKGKTKKVKLGVCDGS